MKPAFSYSFPVGFPMVFMPHWENHWKKKRPTSSRLRPGTDAPSSLRRRLLLRSWRVVVNWKSCPVQTYTGWWFQPSWNNELGWWFPISGKVKHVPNHQPKYESRILKGVKGAEECGGTSSFGEPLGGCQPWNEVGARLFKFTGHACNRGISRKRHMLSMIVFHIII